jgi:hypothetical protein
MGEEEDLRWNTGEEEKEEKPPSIVCIFLYDSISNIGTISYTCL